ncbi:MAG TPA: glycosyltransferase family 4 protein [Lacunisphaera sp.]|nr:glycosyltransferase family 4 protein [Lacunisphaera sp.]
MPNPRLIFVNRVYWPSTQATAQLLTDLAESLAARGWTVHVITAGEPATRHNGVTIHRTGTPEKHSGLLSRAMTHRAFQRAARRQLAAVVKPGDVVVPMTDPPLLAVAVGREVVARGAKIVPWIQDIYPEIAAAHFGPVAGILSLPLKASRDSAWRSAAACVTLGTDMARTVTDRGVPGDRVAILPNWAPRELHLPATPAAIDACRRRWDVADKFVVAYSGNLGRVHEFETMLDAAARLRANASVVFLFIGQGPRFQEVRAAASSRGLDNIRLFPPEPRAALPAALAGADAHLVSLRPTYAALVYPSKLAGVLAAGRPALFIGPTAGDIGRLLANESCGESFAPGDSAGLATIIARWQSDAPERVRLGRAARAAYEKHFTAEAAVSAWEKLLRQASSGI